MIALIRHYAAAIVSGVTLALCFPTWHLYPLAWVAPRPVLCRVHAPRRPRRHGVLRIGRRVLSVLLQWLMSNIYWAGGWAIWAISCYPPHGGLLGLMGFCGRAVRQRLPYLAALSFAVLWAAMEHSKHTLTGFGWGSLGYSQGPTCPYCNGPPSEASPSSPSSSS